MLDHSFLDYLSFSKVRVTFQTRDKVMLPAYKFSAFRGCLGDALFNLVCKYRLEACEVDCPEKFNCVYSQLYNSYQHNHRNYHKSPHPYIIVPLDNQTTVFEPNHTFAFDLILIGKATALFPKLMQSFYVMGETGIGENRGRFIPVGLEAFDIDKGFRQIAFNSIPPVVLFKQLPLPKPGIRTTLVFETPLKLKNENGELLKEKEAPSFSLFAKRLAHRLALLSHFHCDAPLDINSSLIKEIPNIQIFEHDFHYVSTPSYSRNQKDDQFLKGNAGRIIYEGELTQWLPLLYAGSWLHAGLNTTFGFGKYKLKTVDNKTEET